VLDACAAPGGKTSHLLESEPSLTRLIALDIDGSRLEGIAENLHRLRLTAEVRQADAAAPDTWWDGQPLDRILLDAPCSATGVIRRHPDIKLLRRPEDIAGFADRQLTLLQRLWDCLTCGGLLLYTTCSVLKEENENTVERFLSQCGEAKYREIAADWGVQCRFGRQLLPDSEGNDGFYYALLEKMPGSR
jgi:16S rRNA (cytosine967-C5)-methyltransferase